jgi:hypothetical protein
VGAAAEAAEEEAEEAVEEEEEEDVEEKEVVRAGRTILEEEAEGKGPVK